MDNGLIFTLARKIRPELKTMPPGTHRMQSTVEAAGILMLLPTSILSTIWLVLRTDWQAIRDNALPLAILLFFVTLMNQQPFSLNLKLGKDNNTVPVTSSLGNLAVWTGILIFGVPMLWVQFLFNLIMPIRAAWRTSRFSNNYFWSPTFSALQNFAGVFGTLIAITVYEQLGGRFPFASPDFIDWIPAFVAILVDAVLGTILILPIIMILNHLLTIPNNLHTIGRTFLGVSAMLIVSTLFGVLSALIYNAYNFGVIIFFLIGLSMVNTLAYYLSRTNAKSEQRARELAHLEQLSEAIIQAPADASTLQTLLETHVSNMFPQERVEIRLFPPADSAEKLIWPIFGLIVRDTQPPQPDIVWDQLIVSQDNYIVLNDVIPAGMKSAYGDAIAAKVLVGAEGQETPSVCRGGVYLLRPTFVGKTIDSLSAVQTLASQIGSALFRAEVFAETLQLQKARQELEIAGRIQASFLPTDIPQLTGWDIAASILPARQTSGDFYDFVELGNGNIGILVADVADKGTGAALYMALSRTLIRTYAMQYPDAPEEALRAANERILSDTKSDQFVTVFYAILKPNSAELIYANAGHNPAIVVCKNGDHRLLTKTGVPLGMFEGMKWKQSSTQLSTGDILVLYTDGASEAQNSDNEEFGEHRIIEIATQHITNAADDAQNATLEAIQAFVGDAPQFDDITLMIAKRH